MGKYFNRIRFKEHRLHDNGIQGIYDVNEEFYVSICTGGGAYGWAVNYESYILRENRHSEWGDRFKTTFEVALCKRVGGDIVLIDGEEITPKQTYDEVEVFLSLVDERLSLMI